MYIPYLKMMDRRGIILGISIDNKLRRPPNLVTVGSLNDEKLGNLVGGKRHLWSQTTCTKRLKILFFINIS